jgi:uncharacterized protein DUF3300
MIRTFAKQLVSTTLSLLLVLATTPLDAGAQQSAPAASPGYSGQGAPRCTEELQQITAPITFYPDALVAQILGASIFPDQAASAAKWLHQSSSLQDKTLMQAVKNNDQRQKDQPVWQPELCGSGATYRTSKHSTVKPLTITTQHIRLLVQIGE